MRSERLKAAVLPVGLLIILEAWARSVDIHSDALAPPSAVVLALFQAFGDGSILAANISKAKNPADFKIVGEVLSVEPIACMMRKDDAAFKKAVDDSIKRQVADGSLAKLYDKWMMQPVPPTNTKIGLPLSDSTKNAWANPNDKPMEDYVKK